MRIRTIDVEIPSQLACWASFHAHPGFQVASKRVDLSRGTEEPLLHDLKEFVGEIQKEQSFALFPLEVVTPRLASV
jgi:hypothetical protein